jgi:L-aspartate oxidase
LLFHEYDVLIVGSGAAGLYAALHMDPHFKILLLSKKELTLCNSAMAQGGVAAVMNQEDDDISLHMEDTLIAGGYQNDRENLRILVEQGPIDVKNLISYGVDFDKKEDGNIHLTLEGGHSRHRIVHHKDSTGYEIVTTLIPLVKQRNNITVLEHAQLLGLERKDGRFFADVLHNDTHQYYSATACVLATGGIGRVYNFTTNSATATGDGIRFAYKMGAKIKNLSYIQFHPTAYADRHNRECFLISEAVRGEGAFLLNCHKERFMQKYEPIRKELAPRDVVSRCIMQEQKVTNSDEFYLDISYKDPEFLKKRFPMIYSTLLKKGYDLTKQPVPIYPCQHYLMGGIDVNGHGQTTIENLYAAGECAHTGVHGINRLASNSLLEALVFSRRIAENINKTILPKGEYHTVEYAYPSPNGKPLPPGLRTQIRNIMQKSYFVTPNYEEAKKGLKTVQRISSLLETGGFETTPDSVEAKSLATVAAIILSEVVAKGENEQKKE